MPQGDTSAGRNPNSIWPESKTKIEGSKDKGTVHSDLFKASVDDVKDEVFDMVKPQDPKYITCQDLGICKVDFKLIRNGATWD